jgi:hypothetical protein
MIVRRVAVICLCAALGTAGAPIALAASSGHRLPPPKRGTYKLPTTSGSWSKASLRVVKKGNGLAVKGMQWTVTKQESTATLGSCPAGHFTVQGSSPVRWVLSDGTHHQHVWAMGYHKRSYGVGVAPDKVIVKSPSGTEKWTIGVIFSTAKHLKDGQYAFTPGGDAMNHGDTCSYNFNVHHS